jgi:hypothetical protein
VLYSTGDVAELAWPPQAGSTFLKKIKGVTVDTVVHTLLPHTMGGGRSRDGRWGATANHSTGMFQLAPDSLRNGFLDSKNWLDTGLYQSCNPTISPSQDPARMNRMLHLTSGFGNLFGKYYENHKAVIMRSWDDPNLDQPVWYMGPLGDKVDDDGSGNIYWHYPEWSNDENYFVADGSTIIDNWDSADVYLIKINLQGNSKPLRVLQGGGINVVPDLWIKDGTLPARIRLDKSDLSFIALRQDTVEPASQSLNISNAGDGTLPTLQLHGVPKWLKVAILGNGSNNPRLVHTVVRDSAEVGESVAKITVTYGGGVDSAFYRVHFLFRDPVLTKLAPVPATAILKPGQYIQLSARAYDQTGEMMDSSWALKWSAPSGTSGFSDSGKYFVPDEKPAPYGFLAVGKDGQVACTTQVRVVRQYKRVDLGWIRPGESRLPSNWDNAPEFTTDGVARRAFRVPVSTPIVLDSATDPAPDSVYRSVEQITTFRLPGLPKGRYAVRTHFFTLGFIDSSQIQKASLQLEGKTAWEGRYAYPALTSGKLFTAEAKVTVSDTDGLSGEFVGLPAAFLYVAALEVYDIGLPPVTVTGPNGGETVNLGDTLAIRWETDGAITSVGIQVSIDSGKKWIPITRTASVESGDPEWGDFPWAVPDSLDGKSLASSQVMVSVYDYFGTDRDRSDGVFTLQPKAARIGAAPSAGPRRLAANWRAGSGLILRGLQPGLPTDVALLDVRGKWAASIKHLPADPQGQVAWKTDVARGLYRVWIRQNGGILTLPLLVD